MTMHAEGHPFSIALLSESAGLGGAERMMLELADGLRARGGQVHFVTPEAGWLLPAAHAAGHGTTELTGRRGPDVRLLFELVRTLRALKPTVVHAHMFGMAVYGSLAARLLGLPCVITLHEPPVVTEARRRRWALRLAMALADASVAVSERMRRDTRDALGPSAPEAVVIPNGVVPLLGVRHRVREALGLTPEDFLAVAIGTVNTRKNHVVATRALGQLPRALRCHLAIAGRDEGARGVIAAAAAAGGVTDRLHFLGVRHDIGDLLAAADLYLMPSRWEGLPMALIEAMMSGCPVIAAEVGGIPEIIESGVSGYLHEPEDVARLADLWRFLVADPTHRAELAARGRERAIRDFGAEAMTDRYVALYRSVSPRPMRRAS